MSTAAPVAVDEQLRVEALRAAVSIVAAKNRDVRLYVDHVLEVATAFEAWLLRENGE